MAAKSISPKVEDVEPSCHNHVSLFLTVWSDVISFWRALAVVLLILFAQRGK